MAKLAGLGKDNTTSEKVFSVCGGCGELGHKARLRNHPNLRYGNTTNQMNPNFQVPDNQGGYKKPYQGNQQQGFQNNYRHQPPQQGGPTSNFEASKLDEIFEILKEMKKENEIRDKAFNALNKQVGQMAKELARRNPGTLPSDTHVNPAHQGSGSKNLHVNAVSTLSTDGVNELNLKKHDPSRDERWKIFEKVKINLPLLDDIKKVPAHVKCLKRLCTKKRHHKIPSQVQLTMNMDAILSGELPPKLPDPGMPLIAIQIGSFQIDKALLDLGACVSILPGSVYDQYDFGPLKKVDTTVVLADHTSTLPRGMLSDVIVKVGNFYYPVDFLVLDCAESAKDTHPTVILGRPFLATAHAMIDCANGTVGLRFGGREKQINMFEIATNPLVKDECLKANIVDRCDFLSKEDNTKEECFVLHRSEVAKEEQPKEDKDVEKKGASKDNGWIPKWRRVKNEKKAKSLEFDEEQVRLKMFGPNWETWENLPESRKLDFVGYASGDSLFKPP
ncbi:hypothetical protein E3N88_13018 [Mikania micrantha]|uniref:Aspartic peptidase DDI1-type domain-containing protein n=1 Tax=Mikania micrantha TaxID=192012 RepID=A0A5N6P8G5_9ASTR|nr:hypothetical protein E3N88_13018 [Mikania micrantha]